MPKERVVTRRSTEVFMLGQGEPTFPSVGKLPLAGDVMRYMMYRKNLPDFKSSSPSSVICCPLKTNSQDAKCMESGGCCDPSQSSSSKCLVAKVKFDGFWIESGLPVVKDQSILRKVIKIYET